MSRLIKVQTETSLNKASAAHLNVASGEQWLARIYNTLRKSPNRDKKLRSSPLMSTVIAMTFCKFRDIIHRT
jgi:hypothetical protein